MTAGCRLQASGNLEAANARIAARWGQRADEALWRRIETTRALDAVLGIARSSALARWLGGIDAHAGLHAIDRQLRAHWRERVDELAGWMPERWHAALQWCSSGADLPLLQRWARGEPLPGWVTTDPWYAGLQREPSDRTPSVAPPEPWASLARTARADPDRVVVQWFNQFEVRLPPDAGREAILSQLLPLLRQHLMAFAAPHAVDGWAMRRALAARLVMSWRRHPAEPVGAFIHVALLAIEGERLRGELIRRAAFPMRSLAA